MSQIKNNEITHTGNTGTSNIVLDASGNVTVANNVTVGNNVTATGTCTATGGFIGIPDVRNYLINGDMQVSTRGTSFTATNNQNNDDLYTLEQWILLSDDNDVVDITQTIEAWAADSPGHWASMQLEVETANKKFGILQPIESRNARGLISGTASLSFKMKVSATDQWGANSIKAAVVSWSSTADSITSDIVSAWGAEGTRPTLATNWTYENANDSGTTGNFTPTTSWATYKVENVSIDTSSTTNIGVFIWSDVTGTTVGQDLFITDVQLESGSKARDYVRSSYQDELRRCQRYFYTAKEVGATGPISNLTFWGSGNARGALRFPVEMRGNPSLEQITGTDYWKVLSAGATQEPDTLSTAVTNKWAAEWEITDDVSGHTVGLSGWLRAEEGDGRVSFSAEL